MSARSTKKILGSLLEEEDFELEPDFKEIYGTPEMRTFELEFDFGAGEGGQKATVTVPDPLVSAAGDDWAGMVASYAKTHLLDPDDPQYNPVLKLDDFTWLVTVEEIDSSSSIEENLLPEEDFKPEPASQAPEEVEDLTDYKEVYGEGHPTKMGYFVYFSEPVMWEELKSKIGPYKSRAFATKKGIIGLIGNPGVTASIKRESYVPYYPVYDNFEDMKKEFTDPEEALMYAHYMRTGRGVYGVVDADKNVVRSQE